MSLPTTACLVLCLITSLVRAADPEMDQLKKAYREALEKADAPIKAAYVKELQKLLEKHVKAGDLNAATAVKKEIEAVTGKAYQGPALAVAGGSQMSARAELEGLFVDRTWQTPTGTKFTFNPNSTGTKIFGSDPTETITWHHRAPSLVEVAGPGGKTWYFRFVSLKEGYYGTNKDKVNTRLKPPQ